MTLSEGARKKLFPYEPESPWKNNRPVFDRLPVAYKDEQVSSNEGLVYISDPNQKRVGKGSLQVAVPPIEDGTRLLVNSGISSWSEGGVQSSSFLVDLKSLDIDDGQWMFGLLRVISTETGLAAVAPAIFSLNSGDWEGKRFVKLATFETRSFVVRNLRDIRQTTGKLINQVSDWLTQESDEILDKYQLTPAEWSDEYFNPLTAWKRIDAVDPVNVQIDITNQGITNGSGTTTVSTNIYKAGYSITLEVKAVTKSGDTTNIPFTLAQLEDLFTVTGEFLADNTFVWTWSFDSGSTTDFRYLPVGSTLNLTFQVSILQSNDEFWTEGREDGLLDYLAEQLGWNGGQAWAEFNMLPEEKRRLLLGTFGVHSKDKDYTLWPSPFNESVVPDFTVPLNFVKYSDGTMTIFHGETPMETFTEFSLIAGFTYDFNKKPIFEGAVDGDFLFKEGDNGRWFVTPQTGRDRGGYGLTYAEFNQEVSTVANPVANFGKGKIACNIIPWSDNLNWQNYKDLYTGAWNQKGSFLPFNFVADALRLHGYSSCGVSTPYASTSFAYPRCVTTGVAKAYVEGTELVLDVATKVNGWVFVWHRVENIAEGWDYFRLTAKKETTCAELEAKRFTVLSSLTVRQLDELGYSRGVSNQDYILTDVFDEEDFAALKGEVDNLSEGYFFKSDSAVDYETEKFHGPFPNVQFDFNSIVFDNGLFGGTIDCALDEGSFAILRNPEYFISEGIFTPRVSGSIWSRYIQAYPFNYSDWSASFWSSLHFRFLSSTENYLTPLRVWKSADLIVSDSQTYNYKNPLVADTNLGPGAEEKHLYFLRLPPEYTRDSLEWGRAEMVANLLGYFGKAKLPTIYNQTENDGYTPSLMDEEVDAPNLTQYEYGNPVLPWAGLIYQEDFIESSVITDYESGSFERAEIDRTEQEQTFTPADSLLYSPRNLINWDGEYYTRSGSTQLTGNIPADVSAGRLIKVFDGKPIEEFEDGVTKRVWDNRPDLGLVRKLRKEEQHGSNYRVAYAYFAADMSVAGDPVFDPTYKNEPLGYLT